MKLRGISPMQPVCEICDKVLTEEEVGRIFQNNFFHEECFRRIQEWKGGEGKGEREECSARALIAEMG